MLSSANLVSLDTRGAGERQAVPPLGLVGVDKTRAALHDRHLHVLALSGQERAAQAERGRVRTALRGALKLADDLWGHCGRTGMQ